MLYQNEGLWERPVPANISLVAHLSLFNLRGWSLRPGSPSNWFPLSRAPKAHIFELDDFILDRPLELKLDDLLEQPDRCGYRLIRRIYEAFDFGEDAIPAEYDRKTGRLILPE